MKLRTQYKISAWLYNSIFIILAATSIGIWVNYKHQSEASIKIIQSTFEQPVETVEEPIRVIPAGYTERVEALTAKVQSGADLTAAEQAEIDRILNK